MSQDSKLDIAREVAAKCLKGVFKSDRHALQVARGIVAIVEKRLTKRAPDTANVCRVINHFYVDGVCSQCGSKEPPCQRSSTQQRS